MNRLMEGEGNVGFDAARNEYVDVFDAGEGHVIEIGGKEIIE